MDNNIYTTLKTEALLQSIQRLTSVILTRSEQLTQDLLNQKIETELYSRTNILGLVGQMGGANTGAIMEVGQNESGKYLRLAGGIQLCFMTVEMSGIGSGGRSFTHYFPAAFVGDLPETSATPVAAPAGLTRFGVSDRTHQAITLYGQTSIFSTVNARASVTAIGRWY